MKITDTKSLGLAIKARRKELNYTQAYLSEFTGLSVTFISDLERGKPTAEIEKTIKLKGYLAIVFQHEYDHLFGTLFVDRINPVTPFDVPKNSTPVVFKEFDEEE